MDAAADFDVDDIIRRLLAAEDPPSSPSAPPPLSQAEIRHLCAAAKKLLLAQPTLVSVPAPVNVCGDIHGQYPDLLRLFRATGAPSAANRYLFLGDYVDRGMQSIETVCVLLAYKLRYPDSFFLLRGNHECPSLNKTYGFFVECQNRRLFRAWYEFNAVFACLPLAALVVSSSGMKRILCVHGGLSPDLKSLDQIRAVERPLAEVPGDGIVRDLLWSDPAKYDFQKGWGKPCGRRSFGADVVEAFCETHGLAMVCRAHELKEAGYDDHFAGGKLVTVFSAPNYVGTCGNDGAVMAVGDDLACSFHVLKPTPAAQAEASGRAGGAAAPGPGNQGGPDSQTAKVYASVGGGGAPAAAPLHKVVSSLVVWVWQERGRSLMRLSYWTRTLTFLLLLGLLFFFLGLA